MVTSTPEFYVHVKYPVVDLVEVKAVNNAGIYYAGIQTIMIHM